MGLGRVKARGCPTAPSRGRLSRGRIQAQLGLAGVRNALILLAEESPIAVLVIVAEVASVTVTVLEDALTLLVAALEALAALVVVGISSSVEAPLTQNCLLAALDPARFGARPITLGSRVSRQPQSEQTDGQPAQGDAAVRGIAQTARQSVELFIVHE